MASATLRTPGTLRFTSFQDYFSNFRAMPGIGLTPTPGHLATAISLGQVRSLTPPAPLLASLNQILAPVRSADPTRALLLFADTAVEAAAAQLALHITLGGDAAPMQSSAAFHAYVRNTLTRAIPEPLLDTATHDARVPGLIRQHMTALMACASYPDQVAYVQQQAESAQERYHHALYSHAKTATHADLIHAFAVGYTQHLQAETPALDTWLETITPTTSMAIVGPAQSDATFCPRVVVARWLSQELPARWARKTLPIGMIRYYLEQQKSGTVAAEVAKGCSAKGLPIPTGVIPEAVIRTVVNPQVIWKAIPASHTTSIPRPRLVLHDLSASLAGDDAGEVQTASKTTSVAVETPVSTPAPALPVVTAPIRLAFSPVSLTCFPFLEALSKSGDAFAGLIQALTARGVRALDALTLREQALVLTSVYPAHATLCRDFVAELDAQTRTFAPEEFGTDLGAIQETRELSPFWMDVESGLHVVISEDAEHDGGEILETQSDGVGLEIVQLDAARDPEPRPSLDLTDSEQAILQAVFAAQGITAPETLTVLELVDVIDVALPRYADEILAFRQEYKAWQDRDRARSRALSLDLLQERLNAPGTRATKFGRHSSRWVQLLVTEALRSPKAPHPAVILAGTLLPEGPVVDLDHPLSVAGWIHQMAQDRELFHELTIDPAAPETRAYLGLTPDAVLPSAELQKLSSDLEVALVREAREALWASDEAALHPRLEAAVTRLAADRGLDASALLSVVSDTLVPRWSQKNQLYSALALAFITGKEQVVNGRRTWSTRIRRDGQRDWISTWIRPVAAVAFTVQRAAHWKTRALQWGGLTASDADAYVRNLPDFEREFIRVRLHSAFGFMHERFGANRITPTMPLGTGVRRSRQLAAKVHAAA